MSGEECREDLEYFGMSVKVLSYEDDWAGYRQVIKLSK